MIKLTRTWLTGTGKCYFSGRLFGLVSPHVRLSLILLTQNYRKVLALSILSTYGCWNPEVSVHLVGCFRSGAFDIPRVHDIQFCHMRAASEILEFE